MRCEQASRMISARLDGHLDHREAAQLEAHLVMCKHCRARWQKMEALDQLFRSTSLMPAPAHLQARVMRRITRREQARRAIVGGLTLTVGAATLAFIVLIPFVWGLVGNLGVASTLLAGGVKTLTQLLGFFDTLSRALLVLLKQFAVPLSILGLGIILVTLVVNGLWLAAVRGLRASR